MQCWVGMKFVVCRMVCTADDRANLNCGFPFVGLCVCASSSENQLCKLLGIDVVQQSEVCFVLL